MRYEVEGQVMNLRKEGLDNISIVVLTDRCDEFTMSLPNGEGQTLKISDMVKLTLETEGEAK